MQLQLSTRSGHPCQGAQPREAETNDLPARFLSTRQSAQACEWKIPITGCLGPPGSFPVGPPAGRSRSAEHPPGQQETSRTSPDRLWDRPRQRMVVAPGASTLTFSCLSWPAKLLTKCWCRERAVGTEATDRNTPTQKAMGRTRNGSGIAFLTIRWQDERSHQRRPLCRRAFLPELAPIVDSSWLIPFPNLGDAGHA